MKKLMTGPNASGRALPLILLLSALNVPTVQAWWSPDWGQRKTISLNTTSVGVGLQQPLKDVPVLIRLHGGNFPQFLSVRDGGADFRFVAGDDATPLKYHVEKFDAAAQIAMVWVKVPALSPQATDNKLYLYFGNQTSPKGDDPAATYDVDTAAVYHFGDPTGTVMDSTAYATPVVGQVISNPASIVGNGATLAGTTPLTIADAPNVKFTPEKGWAVRLWVKFDALPTTPGYILERGAGANKLALTLNGGQLVAQLGAAQVPAATPLVAGQWHQLGLSYAAGQFALFVDGVQAGSAAATASEMTGPLIIGGGGDGSGLVAMNIDELEISTAARSADYFAFAAAIEGERNDAVVTYGADEAAGQEAGGGEAKKAGHFAIIIQNVFGRKDALVEQVVIGVCVLMAAIALLVMFLKAIYLSRCRRTTQHFLKAYRGLVTASGAPLDGLVSAEKKYRDSPLFSVYHEGINEIRGHMSPAVGAAASGLDDKTLNVLKATLDAVMVREGQRLNAQLVLLTIAISGGPFIGLLGTVIGVMVTFAAIAATGDVNIAAIAPGMAAALLATVAGLGVAIPSLFGYNYLSAKAKEINADMHVFADEFIAKVNQIYGV